MKKKLFTIAIALCMVFTMIPVGVFQIDTAWAATGTPKVTVAGGISMMRNGDDPTYYVNGDTIAIGTEANYNAKYDPQTNTLTLRNFEYKGGLEGVRADYLSSDLKIVLIGTNTIESVKDIESRSPISVSYSGATISGTDREADTLSLTAPEYKMGLSVDGKLVIENTTLTVNKNATGGSGISSDEQIIFDNATVVSEDEGIFAPKIAINNGSKVKVDLTSVQGSTVFAAHADWRYTIVPTFDGGYRWRASSGSDFQLSTTTPITESDVYGDGAQYIEIECGHIHCVCGASHKTVGDHDAIDAKDFKAWVSTTELPTDAGAYYLTDNVTIDTQWNPADGTILCLNGKTIFVDYTSKYSDFDFATIEIQGNRTFTLTDCSADSAGKIENATAASANRKVRGINVLQKANFNMYGGTVKKYSYIGICNSSISKIYNGTITENSAKQGGGVYNNGKLYLYSGTITNNTATENGGGVYECGGAVNPLNVSGDIRIMDNTKVTDGITTTNNVFLSGYGNTITIDSSTGGLKGNAKIGVTTEHPPEKGKPRELVYSDPANSAYYIVADDDLYKTVWDPMTRKLLLKLAPIATIVWDANGGLIDGSKGWLEVDFYEDETVTVPGADRVTKAPETFKEYVFDGWYDAATGGNEVTSFDASSLKAGEENVFYAHFKEVLKKFTVTWDANGGKFTDGNSKVEKQYEYGKYIKVASVGENPTRTTDAQYEYTFAGWYQTTDGSGVDYSENFQVITNDVTFYAHYTKTPREYSVTLHANDGTLAEGDNVTKYTYGTAVTLPTPTREGYNFGGWYDNKDFTGNAITAITATTTGNQEFWAKWTEIPATPPTIVTQPQDVTMNYSDADKSFAVTATVEDGYDISYQWYYNTTGGNASGEPITGATGATYNIPNDTVVGTYYYYCEITAKNRTNQKTASIKTQAVTLKVEKKTGNVTPPIAKENLVYTGAELVLITAGSSTSGTIEYSLDNQNYSTELPTGTDAKSYTVWYRVLGNETYADVAPQSITVKIDKAAGGEAPTGLTPTAPSKWGLSDGKITGVDETMEYADNALFENAKDCTDSTITGLAAGTYYVRVKASDNYEASKAATVIVPVGETEVESIAVTSTTHKTQYFIGEELDVNGLVITATMTDSTTQEVPVTAAMISHFDTSAAGNKTITITYEGKTTTYGITISKRNFSGIKAVSYSGKYDGQAHTITFTGLPEGATVSYGNSEGSYTESAISYTGFTNGAKTVYYKISMDGYNDMTGSATVTIEKRDVTIKVDAKSKVEGSADPEFTGNISGLVNEGDLGTVTYARLTEDADKEKVGDDITITAKYTENSNYEVTVETAKLTITKKPSSGGGGSYIQKPTIVTDEGGNASLSYSGSNLTITAKDGYEITDVLVNGVSKGAVAEITGLKTGDKVEVKTAKKAEPTEPTDPAADNNAKLIKGVENTTIVLKSKLTKNGNVLLTWTKSKGYKVDKFEIYRSVKRSSGYGKAAFFTTKDGSWSKYLNTKNLKAGKTYYYKVRGVRTIDGQKYYTQWSNKGKR